MGIGFQAINDGGTFQVDENWRNYQLVTSGSNSTGTHRVTTYRQYYYVDITFYGCTAPLLAVNSSSGNVCVQGMQNSGSTFTFRVVSGNDVGVVGFSYWLFDVATATPGNVGMEVYNSSGQLVYYSGNKSIRIVDYVGTTRDIVDPPPPYYTYPSGRTYAAVTVIPGFFAQPHSYDKVTQTFGGDYFYVAGTKFSSNIMYFDSIYIGAGPDEYGIINPYAANGSVLVVDVTNA